MSEAAEDTVAVTEEEAVQQEPLKTFKLNVLDVIKQSQNTHGLRYGDYQRYRQYCSRRLRRIRKSLRFTSPQKGKNWIKKPIELEKFNDERYLLLPLMRAERAWSYAMQLREDNGSEDAARKKHHLLRRLKKAVDYSSEFQQLCQTRTDPRTAVEAEAYAAWMLGNINLEREQWEPAMEHFVSVRKVYEELQKVSSGTDKDLCQARLEEVEPSIRYCSYNMQRTGKGQKAQDLEAASRELLELQQTGKGAAFDMLKSKLEGVLAETRKAQAETLGDITWLGEKIAISNTSVKESLLAAQQAREFELQRCTELKARMELYDKILMSYNDAASGLRSDPSAGAAKGYVDHLLLCVTLERNLELAGDYHRKFYNKETVLEGGHNVQPSDLVQLYELILQNLEDLSAIPGVSDDDTMTREFTARKLGFRACRIFWVAESYAANSKHAEAIALYERSAEIANPAVTRLSKLPECRNDVVRVEELQTRLRSRKCAVIAEAAEKGPQGDLCASLGELSIADEEAASKPLLSRLNSYELAAAAPASAPFAEFPPRMEAVPAKPVLFDLAFNHVEFPDLSGRVKKGGLFGFWRRG